MTEPKAGDAVAYRSTAGDTWDATINRVIDADFVDIDLTGPGLREPMELHAVRWRDDPNSTLCGARPKRTE